jgi:hypothetical protein
VIVVVQGRKRAAHEHPWSTIVRIASCPQCSGRPVIKSIDTLWNGRVSGSEGMQNISIFFRCVRILFCWHMAHPLTYSVIHSFVFGHQYFSYVFHSVSL